MNRVPNVLFILGYHVYFWSNEGNPLEPVHVHISKKPHRNGTKVWILSNGTCKVCHNKDCIPLSDLKKIITTISLYHGDVEESWKSHFGKIKYKDKEKQMER